MFLIIDFVCATATTRVCALKSLLCSCIFVPRLMQKCYSINDYAMLSMTMQFSQRLNNTIND
ncbi:hypothetical protein [Helicobacter sp. T3_23-1056]